MAYLFACTPRFSLHFKQPSSIVISNISKNSRFGTNIHKPEKSHSKNPFGDATRDLKLSMKPKLLLTSLKKTTMSLGTCSAIFFTLAYTRDCYAAGIESQLEGIKSLIAQEPNNALSLPTWAIHVSSVVEWMTAMALVWQYGDKPGYKAWKGLSWGMVPLLGGAFCACTWHFFYNAESLEILVALQGALTVIGNFTMLLAAYRIYKSTKGGSKTL
ncbi:uncharacterized protein LOC131061264 [Cryptomeria japonica]|uniref:uncharacterized protein LOC131061264 n=1 Tax=Cryptomeria japonica TaxID=3369 RepID=UPI0027DA9869|nr:uncharacterized protein LOC131061264 [Cryptomeria japonica]